ncbi:hypothetical protein BOX15_Mlig020234g2 [Macrostomum lignano]|uniref:Uncharacterized protein n=1 Tax=Macrostomum lignano TaxID=282301 RepID=A0A267EZA4_9PLAT|nr:hypothetical protein BOX15_Mlig020234g2 [Macrostomum lignano]
MVHHHAQQTPAFPGGQAPSSDKEDKGNMRDGSGDDDSDNNGETDVIVFSGDIQLFSL